MLIFSDTAFPGWETFNLLPAVVHTTVKASLISYLKKTPFRNDRPCDLSLKENKTVMCRRLENRGLCSSLEICVKSCRFVRSR